MKRGLKILSYQLPMALLHPGNKTAAWAQFDS